MKNTDKKIKDCRHKTQLITDYLAGELSNKDSKILEERLESCESCQAKFAELENAWKLTAEMLKGEDIFSQKSDAGKHKTDDNKVIPFEAGQEQKKPDQPKKGWFRKPQKKKWKISFAWGEIAASIILVFAVLLIFPAVNFVKQSASARKIPCSNNLKDIGLSMKMESNVYEDAKPTIGAEVAAEEMPEDLDSEVIEDSLVFGSRSGASRKMALKSGGASKDRNMPAATPEKKLEQNTLLGIKHKPSNKFLKGKSSKGQSTIQDLRRKEKDSLSRKPKAEFQYAGEGRGPSKSKKADLSFDHRRDQPAESTVMNGFSSYSVGVKANKSLPGPPKQTVLPAENAPALDSSVRTIITSDSDSKLIAVDDFLDESGDDDFGGDGGTIEKETNAEISWNYKKPVDVSKTPVSGSVNIPVGGRTLDSKPANQRKLREMEERGSSVEIEAKFVELEKASAKGLYELKNAGKERKRLVDEKYKVVKKEEYHRRESKKRQEKGRFSKLKEIGDMFMPNLSMARESSRKISCINNLKQIGLALRMFSNTNNEEFPKQNGAAGLDELRSEGFLENPQVYICPSTSKKPAKPGDPLTEETVSYYYVGGLTEADSANLPIAFDKNGNHDKYGNILYVDGHVKGYVLRDFKKEVGKVAHLLKKKPVLITKTLTANLKLWDMKTAKGVSDFLQKHKINTAGGSFEIDGNSVKFKLPKAEMDKVEKLFYQLNETEEKMNSIENGLPFLRTRQKPFSTFSIDVDTASYTRVAKEIRQGKRPSSDAVRPEEFINYFDYHYRSPTAGIFGVNLEAAPSKFRPLNTLFRIGIQGKRLGVEENRPSAFTLLIDTSGSMANKNRLELVKEAIPMLLAQMRDKDRISIIVCGSGTKEVTNFVSPKYKDYILNQVNLIKPMGVTDLEKGIIYAYKSAARHYVAGGYNRVMIFTDGISNVSKASAEQILAQIEKARQKGITNTVISVGGDGDDALLEGIADKGDGSYVFLENSESARELFEEQFSARFREIARDVKIQVEFNPKWVSEYRQVGYKNRQLAKSDFRNDSVDAGEVGAGQSVTALYELKVARVMPMERNSAIILPPPDMTIATVRIRYKRADNMAVEEYAYPMTMQDIMPNYAGTSPSFQLASTVAEFAEHLKYPDTQGIANYNTIQKALRPLLSTTYKNDKKVRELSELIRLAK